MSEPHTEPRKMMRYVLYQVDPGWRSLPPEERSLQKKEFADLLAATEGDPGIDVHAYSTVGLRADADICLWEIADGPGPIQDLQARINATELGRLLRPAYSYLAMTRPSQYLGGHRHEGQEDQMPAGPVGSTYLFVYPMVKKREWYALPFEERRRIMGGHFKTGHKYPGVKIHTGYSFGIDDQEFVVAFEGESVSEFLELVEELRGSESSAYTERDVPIFTCVKLAVDAILDQLDGGR
ncbi:MAG TPA: chlorite dismutase family protein [Actinomycetota bacterium]|nr:chlorite dismutase family protein [Actinomycetota bacterium]